jgi:anti-sigma factor RsiW
MNYRRMMQENLDGTLNPERAEELWQLLSEDEDAATENAKLEQVHRMLDKAPHERPTHPQRLAATIMARLARTIEKQANMQELSPEMKLALMMSMSIVQVAMMPVLLAATQMVVTYQQNPAVLSGVIQRVILLQVMMIDALVELLGEVEDMIEKNPESAPVAMSLIPVALKGMLDYVQDETDNIGITTPEFRD